MLRSLRTAGAVAFAALLVPVNALMSARADGAATFEARALVAPGPEGELAGTLLLPTTGEPPYETVLILPGSGPVDRDGNVAGGMSAAPYRLLAEALADVDIASVRIDKRGGFASKGAGDGNDVTLDAYADDVESWLGAIADVPELTGDVWLAGHSEGALIATMTAARQPPAVRGLALLCAPGRPLGTLLREQLADNPANAPILDQAYAAIETLEGGGHVDTDALHPSLAAGLFHEKVQGYLADMMRFDPAAALGALGKRDDPLPVTIVHGGRDIQVSSEDARELATARPDAELVTLAEMNHVFKRVADDNRATNLATYTDPRLPIVPGVADAVAELVGRSRAHR